MEITLLCNAGLAIQCGGETLLVDVPAGTAPPFVPLPAAAWQRILGREGPYAQLAGLWFTHTHPDHCDLTSLAAFCRRWPQVPCMLPQPGDMAGETVLGPFTVTYSAMPHVPIPDPPLHRVAWIEAGGLSIYVAGDAALDTAAHRAFLRGRRADAAFFHAMYLSRPDSRELLKEAAERVWIYHMPGDRNDGIWRKCRKNLERYGAELPHVTVLDHIPASILLSHTTTKP